MLLGRHRKGLVPEKLGTRTIRDPGGHTGMKNAPADQAGSCGYRVPQAKGTSSAGTTGVTGWAPTGSEDSQHHAGK